jgi:hypothetical protein
VVEERRQSSTGTGGGRRIDAEFNRNRWW